MKTLKTITAALLMVLSVSAFANDDSKIEKLKINYNKVQMLNSLQHLQNVEQNCSTEFIIMESTPTQSVVKVTMKYEGFSKISYLSMANTNEGWKIVSVATSFI